MFSTIYFVFLHQVTLILDNICYIDHILYDFYIFYLTLPLYIYHKYF